MNRRPIPARRSARLPARSKARPLALLCAACGFASILLAAPAKSPRSSEPAPAAPAEPAAPDRTAGYKLDPGPYQVGLSDLSLHDDVRSKDLEIRVRYPKNAHPGDRFPLVIFSHGAGGAKTAFPELTEHWASHGYIVVLPTHSDSIQLRRREGQDLSRLRSDPKSLVRDVNPRDRLEDAQLVLDSLDDLEAKIPELREPAPKEGASAPGAAQGRIDRDKLVMAGHSAGAFTTQVAIGVKVRGLRLSGGLELANVGDDRFKAAIVVSGQGLTNRSFSPESWNELSKPMLVIAGSRDTSSISNETPESRRHPFEYAKPGDKYLVYIEGATHASYSGKSAPRLLREEPTTPIDIITDTVASSTLAFLDAILRADDAAKTYLAGDGLQKLSGGAAELKRK